MQFAKTALGLILNETANKKMCIRIQHTHNPYHFNTISTQI